jgi:hypothetical protein
MDKVGLSNSTYKSISGTKGRNAFGAIKAKIKKDGGVLHPGHPDFKLKLSDKAKELSKDIKNPVPNEAQPSSPSTSSSAKVSIPDLPDTPDLTDVAKEVLDKADNIDTAKKAKEVATKKEVKEINKPAVFFIGGVSLFDANFLGNGLKQMTEAVDEGRYYDWDQKNEMIDQIKMRNRNQPVILVGHGFGADTAVEVSQELNTVENGFRTIDLLVTMNSVGTNNDFIPQNVSKNLNFLTADNGWFDDGPNIATNYKRTKVENYLRPEDHSDLDDTTDVQIEVLNAINNLV